MLSPAEIAKNYLTIGAGKTRLPFLRMLILAIFAGMFIALAGVGATVASATVENASAAKLIGAAIFPAGLLMVSLAGSELFTGNSLIILSVLDGRATVRGMLRNWAVVFLGNLIGSLLIAALAVQCHVWELFGGKVGEAMRSAAEAKVSLGFSCAFFRGIACNVLVCIAVWCASGAKSAGGKLAAMYLPVLLFVLCGFEHSVANMYYIPIALMQEHVLPVSETLTWGAFFVKNLLPVTLGNIVGGAGLVGCGYWLAYLRGEKVSVS